MQKSLAGQLRRFLESISGMTPAGASGSASSAASGTAAWEEVLRMSFQWRRTESPASRINCSDYQSLRGKRGDALGLLPLAFRHDSFGLENHVSRVAPFLIRMQRMEPLTSKEKLLQELGIFGGSKLLDALRLMDEWQQTCFTSGEIDASYISEWCILELFLLDALEEGNALVATWMQWGNGSAPHKAMHNEPGGFFSLFCQYMQMLGVVVGLSLRLRLATNKLDISIADCVFLLDPCVLPPEPREEEQETQLHCFRKSALLAFREGIVSVCHENYFKLLSPVDLLSLIGTSEEQTVNGMEVDGYWLQHGGLMVFSHSSVPSVRRLYSMVSLVMHQLSHEAITLLLASVMELYACKPLDDDGWVLAVLRGSLRQSPTRPLITVRCAQDAHEDDLIWWNYSKQDEMVYLMVSSQLKDMNSVVTAILALM